MKIQVKHAAEQQRGRGKEGTSAFFLSVLCADNDIIGVTNATSTPPPSSTATFLVSSLRSGRQRTVATCPPAGCQTIKKRAAVGLCVEGIPQLGSSDRSPNTDWAPCQPVLAPSEVIILISDFFSFFSTFRVIFSNRQRPRRFNCFLRAAPLRAVMKRHPIWAHHITCVPGGHR